MTSSGFSLFDGTRPAAVETARGALEVVEHGAGPAVLCLHGAMGGWDQAAILARTLGEEGYRYLAISRPGYLGTPLARGATPERQADLYAALLDALGRERAAVLAISGGGPSAIHFALRHGARCWALVLVSTVAGPADNRLPLSFALLKLLARCSWFTAATRRKVASRPERAASRAITDPALLERTLGDPEAWALLQALQLSTVDAIGQRIAGTENDVAVTRSRSYPLEAIAAPTLVVQGTRDPLVPLAQHGAVLAARVPDAELLPLEGGEHAAIFSHRDEARAAVTAFLRRHAPV